MSFLWVLSSLYISSNENKNALEVNTKSGNSNVVILSWGNYVVCVIFDIFILFCVFLVLFLLFPCPLRVFLYCIATWSFWLSFEYTAGAAKYVTHL